MVVRAVTRRLPARPSVLGSLSTANWSCVKALRLETRRVFPPCPMENRAAAAHAETSKTWAPPARSRRAMPDRSRPTQGPGRLRPGGRNNTSTVAKNPATGHARHGNERRSRPVPSPRNTGLLGRKNQADLGGLGRVHRHVLDEAVGGLDAVRPDLDAVLADRDGVAGEALTGGTVATGFLVSVGVLDVRAGLKRVAVGRDLDPDRPAGDFHALRGGFHGFHRDAVLEMDTDERSLGENVFSTCKFR